jgi:hypothetical protein
MELTRPIMEIPISTARGGRNVAPFATLRRFALSRIQPAQEQTVGQLLPVLEVAEAAL